MIQRKVLIFLVVISIVIANNDARKVIFAKNTTAEAISKEKQLEEVNESTIINVPSNCKPGFVESSLNKRCRKVATG